MSWEEAIQLDSPLGFEGKYLRQSVQWDRVCESWPKQIKVRPKPSFFGSLAFSVKGKDLENLNYVEGEPTVLKGRQLTSERS